MDFKQLECIKNKEEQTKTLTIKQIQVAQYLDMVIDMMEAIDPDYQDSKERVKSLEI